MPRPFYICIISLIILGSVFSDCVVFYGDVFIAVDGRAERRRAA